MPTCSFHVVTVGGGGGSMGGSRCGPGLDAVCMEGVEAGTHRCQSHGVLMWAWAVRALGGVGQALAFGQGMRR